MAAEVPEWLTEHRKLRPYGNAGNEVYGFAGAEGIIFSRGGIPAAVDPLLMDQAFASHARNDGSHVSPYDEGRVDIGYDNLRVHLVQEIDEAAFRHTLSRALRATTGIHPDEVTDADSDTDMMMRGGLQSALESQVIVFEVSGASRALTHQLVRTRKAAFHQQSQRATWYGDRPNARWPMSVWTQDAKYDETHVDVLLKWEKAQLASWEAYQAACDAGISYQDARYILPEGTTNYILCEYTVREFINVFAYRGCTMFAWEMVKCMRLMREQLLAAHPFLEPYIKISCEKPVGDCEPCSGTGKTFDSSSGEAPYYGENCQYCGGDGKARRCTFQGWEIVEDQCQFPWARENNRTFMPDPKYRIERPVADAVTYDCPDCDLGDHLDGGFYTGELCPCQTCQGTGHVKSGPKAQQALKILDREGEI
jgi:flavin-dependent thymidylate synthase